MPESRPQIPSAYQGKNTIVPKKVFRFAKPDWNSKAIRNLIASKKHNLSPNFNNQRQKRIFPSAQPDYDAKIFEAAPGFKKLDIQNLQNKSALSLTGLKIVYRKVGPKIVPIGIENANISESEKQRIL